jgi:hypothetical protein
MKLMLKLRGVRCVAWLLLALLGVPYIITGAAAAVAPAPTGPKSVLFFTLDSQDEKVALQAASDLSNFVKDGLETSGKYDVITFSQRLPAVVRLLQLQPEMKAILTGPYSSDSTAIGHAVTLGKAVGADIVIVGSLDKYSVGADNSTEASATLMMIDANTGKTLNSVVVTGHGTKPAYKRVALVAGGSSTESRQDDAVMDAGRKIVTSITGQQFASSQNSSSNPTAAQITGAHKKNNVSWAAILLASVGIGLLLSKSGGGSSSAPASSGPPAPPF